MTKHHLQDTCLGVIVGTPLLAAISVFLRVYSRRKLNVRLGWDDWCIIAALILSVAVVPVSWKFVKMWHVGWHIWEIPSYELEPDFDEYYAVLLSFNLLNSPILPLVKVSMILLLLRIGSVISWLKKVLYGILALIVGFSLIPWFIFIFICPPATGNTWKPRTFGGLHCMGRYKMGEMIIWLTCANLFTDLLILPIPFIIVKRWLSANWRSKLVVCAVFMCGLAVTGIGAAKIYYSYRDRLYGQTNRADWTYDINYCINHIENNVAIIMGNIPILRGLVTRWMSIFRPNRNRSRTANSRTGHTLLERELRFGWPWKSYKSADFNSFAIKSNHSTGFGRHMRRQSSSEQKMVPCAQEDFDFSFVTMPEDVCPKTPEPVRSSPEFGKASTRVFTSPV